MRWLLWVAVIGTTGCSAPSVSGSAATESKEVSSSVPASTDSAAKAPESKSVATIGGKPIASVTGAEIIQAAKSAGWELISGIPVDMALMERKSKGRETLTVGFQKGKTALAVMLVRPVPGMKPADDSDIINAKTTMEAFQNEATYLDGEIGVVVSARPGMGENPSKAIKQSLLDALVKH